MAARTNRSALGTTVRALRRADRLGPEDLALVRLAELLAGQLDEALTAGEKAYGIAALGRLYFMVEEALRTAAVPVVEQPDDPFALFMARLTAPTPGFDGEAARDDGPRVWPEPRTSPDAMSVKFR